MKSIIPILIVYLFSQNLYAYQPTVESLFRNGNNADIVSNLITLKMRFQEVLNGQPAPARSAQDESAVKAAPTPMAVQEEAAEYYLKLQFLVENQDKIRFLQVLYNNGRMDSGSIVAGTANANFIQRIKNEKENDVNKEAFYSGLSSLVLNREGPMVWLIGKLSNDFVPSSELVNKEKVKKLEEYRAYLGKIKENPNMKATTESPLRPKDPGERKAVTKLMNDSLYRSTDKIKLVKEDNEVMLKVLLNSFSASFNNETHRLSHLTYGEGEEMGKIDFYDYFRPDGIHELPKNWVIKTSTNKVYSLQVLEMSQSNSNLKNFDGLIDALREKLLSFQKKKNKVPPPSVGFLF